MTTIRTQLGIVESARRVRVEPVAGIAHTNVQTALQAQALGQRAQRSIAGVGDLPIQTTDGILNVNAASDLAIAVPAASTRGGAPLTFANLYGSHAQTLNRTAPDFLDNGLMQRTLNAGQVITLTPFNDGVNNTLGYKVE